MLGLAYRRARRASAVAAMLVVALAFPVSGARPKPEPDSDDVSFVVTEPGQGQKKPKGKAAGKGARGAKPPAQKSAPKAAPATPKAKPGEKKLAEPESDDVVLTTTAPDGTKIEEIELEEDESLAAPPAPPEPPPRRGKLNWAGLYFQQDSLIFSALKNVCPSVDANGRRTAGHPDFSCRDADSVYQSRVYSGAGNQVGGGFGLATTRLMLGFDRVFLERVTAGARVGYAFRLAPTVDGVAASLPLHLELRGAYHFLGARPFEEGGLHPFAGLGLGLAEVDGVVAVSVYRDAAAHAAKKPSRLHAWRRTGTGFAAPTVGATYGLTKLGLLFTAELRTLVMFPASAVGFSLGLGAAYGL